MSTVVTVRRFRRRFNPIRVFRDRRNPFDCFDDNQFYNGMYVDFLFAILS